MESAVGYSRIFSDAESFGINFHYNSHANDTTRNILLRRTLFYVYNGYLLSDLKLIPGQAVVLEQYIYSSSYDVGEFWSSDFATQDYPGYRTPVTITRIILFVYNGGPSANLKFGAAGCSDTLRNIQVKVNNILFKDTALNGFNDIVTNFNDSAHHALNSASTNIQFINNSQATTYADRMVVSFYELTYPRQFNFGGLANFSFHLACKCQRLFSENFQFQFRSINTGII